MRVREETQEDGDAGDKETRDFEEKTCYGKDARERSDACYSGVSL